MWNMFFSLLCVWWITSYYMIYADFVRSWQVFIFTFKTKNVVYFVTKVMPFFFLLSLNGTFRRCFCRNSCVITLSLCCWTLDKFRKCVEHVYARLFWIKSRPQGMYIPYRTLLIIQWEQMGYLLGFHALFNQMSLFPAQWCQWWLCFRLNIDRFRMYI